MNRLAAKTTAVVGVSLVLGLMAYDVAEARRGGSFGSRGSRTYHAPRTTETAPQRTAPIERSMTAPQKPATAAPAPAAAAQTAQPRPRGGFLGGFGGGILGGLVAGGLLGMMLGNGWGGFGAGLGNTLMQLAIIGLGVWLLMALFRRRSPAPAGHARSAFEGPPSVGRGFEGPIVPPQPSYAPQGSGPALEIPVTQADRETFERLLTEVQEAFGREDYGALRERTTPEIMSYLSEELSQNAVQGRRNAVSRVRLVQADVAEAWAEGDTEYVTAALRYESVDVMHDRATGAVVEGDPDRPTETVELWTFVRRAGDPWKLSAIQEA